MKTTGSSFAAAARLSMLPGFSERYEVIEYLPGGSQSDTYVIKSHQTGRYLLAKLYEKRPDSGGEAAILTGLDHPCIPKPADTIQTEERICFIRDYVEGLSLNKLSIPLNETRVTDIGVQLCDILTYLHSRTPPVIHRDIKPQNVILDDDGRVHLVDFGISRHFNDSASQDTVFIGTEGYAPPEQYGFMQTDCRSDIYSLGMLLCFLLTGGRDIGLLDEANGSGLARVIRKCAGFAPKERYASAEAVKKDLLRISKKRARWIAAVLIPLVAAAVWFAWPFGEKEARPDIDTSVPPVIVSEAPSVAGETIPPAIEGVVFAEPLIEQAVRAVLGLDAGDVLRKNDLFGVTCLLIWADRTFAAYDGPDGIALYQDALYRGLATRDPAVPPITTLEDLIMMPSLRWVMIGEQQITDVTPLTSIEFLDDICLMGNPIEDLSPLAAIQTLEKAYISGAPFLDLSPLAGLPHLTHLAISNDNFFDLRPLRELRGLELLHIQTPMDHWKYLPDCPLREYCSGGGMESLQWLDAYKPTLQRLDISWSSLESLAGIEAFTELRSLAIYHTGITDLTPLLLLPNLQTVEIDSALQGAADAIRDRAKFAFVPYIYE